MKVHAFVQARMSSRRLPGKALMPLHGKPVLEWVISRVKICRFIEEVFILTSTDPSDDSIEFCAQKNTIRCFRGELDDVLGRFYGAAFEYESDYIVRVTADCPLIEPTIIDAIVLGCIAGKYDYYGLSGQFPDGFDCTVFSRKGLLESAEMARLPSEREHIGQYIENNPDAFKTGGLEIFERLDSLRLTLDEAVDLTVLEMVISKCIEHGLELSGHNLISILRDYPEIAAKNRHILRNEGLIKSLREEGYNEVR